MEKLEPCSLLAGMYNNAAVVENSMAGPQKIKHRITVMIQLSYPRVYIPEN